MHPILSRIRIRIADLWHHGYLKLRLHAHRIIHGTRFKSPKLYCETLVESLPTTLEFPDEFRKLWKNGRETYFTYFPGEASFKYCGDSPTQILNGRYIQLVDRTFLDTGKQAGHRFRDLESEIKASQPISATTVVVPWGLGSASYGDFIIQILPKLCRLIASVVPSAREQIYLCLPEFSHYPWARDYLHLVGIGEKNIHDGKTTVEVPIGGNILVGTGPSSACNIAHPDDLRLMRKTIAEHFPPPPDKPHRKIYISRKTGRSMENEAELVTGLEKRGFEIISLEGLTVREQIVLFREASFIAGPHGAGHANLMWSAPGATLLEVFHPSWMHPCYGILATAMGLKYYCLVGKNGLEPGGWTEKSRFGIFEGAEKSRFGISRIR